MNLPSFLFPFPDSKQREETRNIILKIIERQFVNVQYVRFRP